MVELGLVGSPKQIKTLSASTVAFTACFSVWTIFSIIGVQLKADLGLNDTQFGLLIGTPILTGSLSRILLGVWAEQYGGRIVYLSVMLCASLATFLLSFADTFSLTLLAALGVGVAGGSFAVGVAYVSKWYPKNKQGSALGIFGIGNVGAAATTFLAPLVLVAFGWTAVAQIWAGVLAFVAILFWFFTEDEPDISARRSRKAPPQSFIEHLEPLKDIQVWRFSVYYFFVFGAFVALALWLPRYLMGVYDLDIGTAGMLTACFVIPASLFRAYGGFLSDKYGARIVMYMTFGVSVVCTFMLSYPETDYIIHGIDGPISFSTSMALVPFVILTFVLGFFMSLGKAAVYKHIPVYYADHVGAVGGLVGMVGGLGGFFLPIAFGVMMDVTGIWTSCFMLLFALVTVALLWMHFAIRRMEKDALPEKMRALPELPEMESIHLHEEHHARMGHTLDVWHPDDETFWENTGRRIARRNLWISVPCLLLAFSVWLVWSVVVAKLPAVGFDYTTNQLFWLAAVPGLSGATLRIFYSFMVPIMGGRLWTTLSTATLLIPALGIGYAVQNPQTPYLIFLILALLCGFGGGNFASSMANISFFFPKSEKGNALALNAGLGNAGVSIMQFVVPIVVVGGVFGVIGGEPQITATGEEMWLQNAGFVWVPFLLVATLAAWFGMNDIASAQASFHEQAVIFTRKHNWVMCVLYTGTFGSFIGYSAGFPLLSQLEFPETDALQYVFLGPLVGALSRAGTGWLADKVGGGRVTFWTFISMIIAVLGVLYFLANKEQPGAFWGFFTMFMFLFFATGVGNASTFQMIPVIMGKEIRRLMPTLATSEQRRHADRESAAIIGFTSAIAAYGAFFIPKSYGTAIAATGSPMIALWGFLLFYILCTIATWWYYTRRQGLLYADEHGEGSTVTVSPVTAVSS